MKSFIALILHALLSIGLIFSGCSSTTAIKRPRAKPFLSYKPVSKKDLAQLKKDSPKDKVFFDLLQAFSLMRSKDIENKQTQKEILNLLQQSVATFDDLKDPINFSRAFTEDESKPFRGRPHERLFASLSAGIFFMAEGNYEMALPYLRNAEFLDARFQKLPFGTDAPLIYMLMYRCLYLQNAPKDELNRAKEGIYTSIRFLSMKETLIDILLKIEESDLRIMAISNRIAYMLMEIGIYNALLSSSIHEPIESIIDTASKNANIFIASLGDNFEKEFKERLEPVIDEQAKILGLSKKQGRNYLHDLAFSRVSNDLATIGNHLKKIYKDHAQYRNAIKNDFAVTNKLTNQVINAAKKNKLMLKFDGYGPKIALRGSYGEIAVTIPSKDADTSSKIRQKKMTAPTKCGFHHQKDSSFFLVLCKNEHGDERQTRKNIKALELLSLSRKAMSAQGRKFDKILRGRAQFRASTEQVMEIGAWSALFLFHLGTSVLNECQKRGEDIKSCYARAGTFYAIGGLTIAVTGSIWLIGKTVNPAADARYINSMYESVWVSI